MLVQRKIILKHQKQTKKWEETKHKKDLLTLKKNEFNKLTLPQLKDKLYLKKGTEDGPLPTTKKDLIKLWIEWERKLETNWILSKNILEKNSNVSLI